MLLYWSNWADLDIWENLFWLLRLSVLKCIFETFYWVECGVLFVTDYRSNTFKRLQGVPPSTASIISALRTATSLPLRAESVSSSIMCVVSTQLFVLAECREEQSLAAGMWISTEWWEQKRLPLCLESEQNIGKKAAWKEKHVQGGFVLRPWLIFMTLLKRTVCFRDCTWSFLSVGRNRMWLLFSYLINCQLQVLLTEHSE